MAVTTNLNSNTKSNGKITEVPTNLNSNWHTANASCLNNLSYLTFSNFTFQLFVLCCVIDLARGSKTSVFNRY